MASDRERIKAALEQLVPAIIKASGDSLWPSEARRILECRALEAAILSLIRETREECAGAAKDNRDRWVRTDGFEDFVTAAGVIETAIRALNEEDKHGD